jgi:hypothetical protein
VERILEELELRPGGLALFIIYADNIEAPLARWWKTSEVVSCNGTQFAALGWVDCCFCWLHIMRSSSFHFNEAQHILIPTNEIDLAAPAVRSIVTGHDDIAKLPQMKISVFLASPSGQLMRREIHAPRHATRNAVQQIQHGFGKLWIQLRDLRRKLAAPQ